MPQMFPMSWALLPAFFLLLFLISIAKMYTMFLMAPPYSLTPQTSMVLPWKW